MKKYPDMTELFARKEARRKVLANLPIEQKMEIAQQLQEIAKKAPGRHVQPQAKRAPRAKVRIGTNLDSET